MQSKKKILWGIILVIVAAAIITFAFCPQLLVINIPLWKIIVGIGLLFWIIGKVVCGKTLKDHFDFFFPLGLGMIIFEKEIASLLHIDGKLYSHGLILAAAIILSIAVNLIFGNIKSENKAEVAEGNTHKNSYSARTLYIDATSSETVSIENKFGATEVFFQNTEIADSTTVLNIYMDNKFGAIEVHAPADWTVESLIDSSMGAVEVRKNTILNGKKIVLNGVNRFGGIEVK